MLKKVALSLLCYCTYIHIANATKIDAEGTQELKKPEIHNFGFGLEYGAELKYMVDTRQQVGAFLQYYVNKYFSLETGVGHDDLQFHCQVYGLYIKNGIRLYFKRWNLGLFYKPYIPLNRANIDYSARGMAPDKAKKASPYWGQLFFDFGFKTSIDIYINLGISTLINYTEWKLRNDFNFKGNKNISISGLKSIEAMFYLFLRYDAMPLFRKIYST